MGYARKAPVKFVDVTEEIAPEIAMNRSKPLAVAGTRVNRQASVKASERGCIPAGYKGPGTSMAVETGPEMTTIADHGLSPIQLSGGARSKGGRGLATCLNCAADPTARSAKREDL
jgi:hypothetical protein